ncbi:MAG: quinone-dependent dihydroorotate dehydrogenase [Bacteroidales bacterium]|nr:quinone-dependent dihydroorotate dehydrogenase [Bacteroidales bacterium]
MSFYTRIIRPALFVLSPEKVHHLTFSLLNFFKPILPWFFPSRINDNHSVVLLGLNFKHPVGLAAGLDKDGIAYEALMKLGFSFIELGTVTPKPQPGNPKPRLFRIPEDKALINRMGFNNSGVDALVIKLKNRPKSMIIGGNIGKNTNTPNADAAGDYLYCFEKLYQYVDYFVVNVSCPNIQDLRELQDKDSLILILDSLIRYRSTQEFSKPILLKVSPDLNENQLDDLVEVVKETKIDGLLATNTTITRTGLSSEKSVIEKLGAGGMSGKPLSKRSSEVIRFLRSRLGSDFPIIASGGIMTKEDALEKIEAGAQLVQIYTGFIYEGPALIQRIKLGIQGHKIENQKTNQKKEA